MIGGVDGDVLHWMQAHTTPDGLAFFAFVTGFGSPSAIALLAAIVGACLWRRGEHRLSLGYVLAVAGGGLLNRVLKLWIQRARPPGALDLLVAPSFSFPSGHTMGTTIGLGLLYVVVVTCWPLSGRARRVLAAGCAIGVLLVAGSRVYLGAHYLTDVLGGLAFGLLWVGLCVRLLVWERRRVRAG